MKSFAEPRLGLLMIVGAFSLFVGMVHLDAGAVAQDQPTAAANDKGQAALAAGREALAEGRWQEAINRFTEALGYLPGNEEALAGRDLTRVHPPLTDRLTGLHHLDEAVKQVRGIMRTR